MLSYLLIITDANSLVERLFICLLVLTRIKAQKAVLQTYKEFLAVVLALISWEIVYLI